MALNIYNQIQNLYDQKLFTNLSVLGPMVLSAIEQNPDLLNPTAIAQTMAYVAEAFLEQKEYGRAEAYFRKSLAMRKNLTKQRGYGGNTAKELMAEKDLRFQLHLCHVGMKQNVEALIVLQAIPAKLRNVKINMALGKLYVVNGMERPAISAFKEVLRESPLALEAVQELIKLGVPYTELMKLTTLNSSSTEMEWLSTWIKGQCHLQSQEYPAATSVFLQLKERSLLQDDVSTLISLGRALYLSGDIKGAILPLQRAHLKEPMSFKGMDILSAALAHEKRKADLESLSLELLGYSQNDCEPWICAGYFYVTSRKLTSALSAAHKACSVGPTSIDALILKGTVLMELKKYSEAMTHFREAQQLSNSRYEIYKGIVNCYVSMQRIREAVTYAGDALRQLGQTPRSLTLYASVLVKDPVTISKGKSCLEKVLKIDPYYAPAIFLLIEAYEQVGLRGKAVELLEKQIEQRPTSRLHHCLGTLLAKNGDQEKAMEHYTTALVLEPNSLKTREAINRLENAAVAKMENAAELDTDEVPDSEDEPTIEDADMDPTWADIEFSSHFNSR